MDSSKKSQQTSFRKDRVEIVFAILFLVFGIVVILGSRDLPYMGEYGPGAAFLPIYLGIGIILLSLALLVRFIFIRRYREEDFLLPSRNAARQIVLVMLGLFGFVFLADKVGFLLCIGLLFFFILYFVEQRRWKFSLAISLISFILFWVIFELGLKLRLPPGLLDLLR